MRAVMTGMHLPNAYFTVSKRKSDLIRCSFCRRWVDGLQSQNLTEMAGLPSAG
jgi:hypothetical protein